MIFQKGDKLIMAGDSVTDCGRSPAGEGFSPDLGNGYVANVSALLTAAYPELFIRVVNKGNGGNCSTHLLERWEADVMANNPDWVSIMIGINDVWRHFDQYLMPEVRVSLECYRENLREIIERTIPHVKGLILMTPFFMEPLKADSMRAMTDQYAEVVRELASEYRLTMVDTQAAFDKLFTNFHSGGVAWDRVHPNHVGHMVLAREFLRAVGFDYNR